MARTRSAAAKEALASHSDSKKEVVQKPALKGVQKQQARKGSVAKAIVEKSRKAVGKAENMQLPRTRKSVSAKAADAPQKRKCVRKDPTVRGFQKMTTRSRSVAKAIVEKNKNPAISSSNGGAVQKRRYVKKEPDTSVLQSAGIRRSSTRLAERRENAAIMHALKVEQARKSITQRNPRLTTIKTEPMEEIQMNVEDEDFLSQLHSDCLDVILTMLNQEDLDALSSVNRRMYAATAYSRPRSIKTRATNLTIAQIDSNTTAAVLALPVVKKNARRSYQTPSTTYLRMFEMRINSTEAKYTQKFEHKGLSADSTVHNSSLPLSKITPVRVKMMNHLLPQLERFAFDSYTFHAVGINNRFLEDFKQIGSRTLHSIRFDRCAFDVKLGSEGRDRFLSLLLSAKPGRIVLDFPRKDNAKVFDLEFIRRYAAVVNNPQLTIVRKKEAMTVTREFLPSLVRFEYLSAFALVVEPEHLLDMILVRLDMDPIEARWYVSVSGCGGFTDEILARLDMTNYYRPSFYSIAKTGARFGAEYVFDHDIDTGRLTAYIAFTEIDE